MWVHVKEKLVLQDMTRKASVLSASLHFPRADICLFICWCCFSWCRVEQIKYSVFLLYIHLYVCIFLQHLAVYIIYVTYKQLALEGIPQWLKY